MQRFRCPECGIETEVAPRHGGEIVSAYCLRHAGGADQHTRPVYMQPAPLPRPALEAVVVATRAGRESGGDALGIVRASPVPAGLSR